MGHGVLNYAAMYGHRRGRGHWGMARRAAAHIFERLDGDVEGRGVGRTLQRWGAGHHRDPVRDIWMATASACVYTGFTNVCYCMGYEGGEQLFSYLKIHTS